MRPGNERDNARRGAIPTAAAARAKAEDWWPLLEILRNADSPVGAAVHWVETHGGNGGGRAATGGDFGGGKRRKVCELWRFVPELLASEVVYVEEEEEEEEEQDKAKSRIGGRVGNCMWMQTLPSALQTSILTFLNVEHLRFHAKDLELLARCILSSPVDPEFWLFQAARTLLNTALDHLGIKLPPAPEDKCTLVGMEEYNALPDWLEKYTEQKNTSSSSFPPGQSSLSKEAKHVHENEDQIEKQENLQGPKGKSNLGTELDEPGSLHHSVPSLPENAQDIGHGIKVTDVQTSTLEIVEDKLLSKSDNAETKGKGVDGTLDGSELQDDCPKKLASEEETVAKEDLGDEGFAQALSLRQALHSCQAGGLPEEISLIRSTPKLPIFLSVVRAWEVDDEVTLLLVGSLLTERDGYAWSTQILQSIFLSKLLEMERPASRILMTAWAQAGKIHPRATMDAVVFPLICSETGASNVQCEVINRMVKDCLPDEVNSSLCERMFAAWEAKNHNSRSKASWVWTEGMVTVVQNLLSLRLNLDQRTVAGLVCALDGAVTEYSTSLKFGNLLLNLLTKYGSKVKPHKAILQMVASRTKTFLTKSLLTKLAAI